MNDVRAYRPTEPEPQSSTPGEGGGTGRVLVSEDPSVPYARALRKGVELSHGPPTGAQAIGDLLVGQRCSAALTRWSIGASGD